MPTGVFSMSKATTFDPTSEEPVAYQEAVGKCIERIDSLRSQMAAEQEEIDRLKSETNEILERLKAA
jgi:hypothetical protein